MTDAGEKEDATEGDRQIVDVSVVGFEQKIVVRLMPSRLVGVLKHGADVLVHILQGILFGELRKEHVRFMQTSRWLVNIG